MKAIIFGRVSTEGQDIDQQTERLIERAILDGFSQENIITISVKESGISLKETERKGIIQLKELAEPGDTVYLYEITRLARRGDVNFNIKQFLVDNHIQLICLKPELKLLDEDGQVNQMANVAFGMLAVFAEQEMYNAKDRMQRGKYYAKLQGRFTGGRLRFGYGLDRSKRFIVKPEEAKIINDVFSLMASGNHSIKSISITLGLTVKKVQNILAGNEYFDCSYPPIITEELYRKAHESLERNQKKPKTITKHIFLGKGLIKDEYGYTMLGKVRGKRNEMEQSKGYYAHSVHSGSTLTIASQKLDELIWLVASSEYQNLIDLGETEKKEEQRLLEERLARIENDIVQEKEILEKIEKRFILGKITEDLADSLGFQHKGIIRTLESTRLTIIEQLGQLNTIKPLQTTTDITDPELKRNIILQVIDHIQITKLGRYSYRLIFHFSNPLCPDHEEFFQTRVKIC